METRHKVKPQNCSFGPHLNSIDKERLIELCEKTIKEEAPDSLSEMDPEEIKNLYTSFVMEKVGFEPPSVREKRQ